MKLFIRWFFLCFCAWLQFQIIEKQNTDGSVYASSVFNVLFLFWLLGHTNCQPKLIFSDNNVEIVWCGVVAIVSDSVRVHSIGRALCKKTFVFVLIALITNWLMVIVVFGQSTTEQKLFLCKTSKIKCDLQQSISSMFIQR